MTLIDTVKNPAEVLTPGIDLADSQAAYWLAQVNLRLRRELLWCWRQRADFVSSPANALPPIVDGPSENLDWVRYEDEKRHFYANDVTARYLSGLIAQPIPEPEGAPLRGSWAWLAAELNLDHAGQLVLAVALAAHLDAGLAPVFASCANDINRPYPSLALAQRLWHEPLEIIRYADPGNKLFRCGVLNLGEASPAQLWQAHLLMPSQVINLLLQPDADLPSALIRVIPDASKTLNANGEALLARLKGQHLTRLQMIPLIGHTDSDFNGWAATLSHSSGRDLLSVADGYPLDMLELSNLAVYCWMRGADLLLPLTWAQKDDEGWTTLGITRLQGLAIRCYIPLLERSQLKSLPVAGLTPPLEIEGLDFNQRKAALTKALGKRAKILMPTIAECARRFRFQERTLSRVAETLAAIPVVTANNLIDACRIEATEELNGLAERVSPRFTLDELVLSSRQQRKFEEILKAMSSLTKVHYQWGTAKAWNESGLSVLFYGPPGTGKTMGAEVLSSKLALPMYRIDLSQVVNKYIGETEKNLKRIFDAAELSDCILFFDEADALFGKRTEVKDAHDRFANIEISYLLERMERFKGLAILATNRRKDLDEAFMRRLRYVIEFHLPGKMERERIWRQVFPLQVDVSEIDFPYLAGQFQLSGGHIRSVAFNACLQAAASENGSSKKSKVVGKVGMKEVLVAVKRELEKLDRTASDELFGNYQTTIEEALA